MSPLGRRQIPDDDPPLKPSRTILMQEIEQAEEEIHRSVRGLLLSGVIAAFTIGVSPLLAAYVLSAGGDVTSPSVLRLLAAHAYTIGFILVILARTDLFTEFTTIAILPVLTRDATVWALARLWMLVLAGNLIGGGAFAAISAALAPALTGLEPSIQGELARGLAHAPVPVILASAVLAGWFMGVLSWLIIAARDTISQIAFVWAIAFIIGVLHLHHAVTGSIDVMTGWFAGQGIGPGDFAYFVGWTTLGNSAGGILFALLIRFSLVQHEDPGGARAHRAPPD